MTDLEKYTALLKEFGITFKATMEADGSTDVHVEKDGDSKAVNGYNWFFFDFSFGPSGEFIEVWIGE